MKSIIAVFLAIVYLGSIAPLQAEAEESVQKEGIAELNQIMVADEAFEAKELPDDNSASVITYQSGQSVFVTGETADGWYKVSYQDKEGYVRKSLLFIQEFDVEGLDKEFQELEMESKILVEEVERYRTEARRSRIWGIVIVLLVAGIFVTGIISTKRMEREKTR
ncbi:SH3 domain-containing protein [Parablautia intestinalis]|uniref:SH3 domain-containing protein n=1 Tax=Parablautia intestinalis TaxID=2320100 RepID=A0A3A9AUW6_9FIRM|nr:SH3 domain-containing protein [Parablautia intestinalis]RKI91323.1 SH3 domain-containing protein [Parablautia intestinalis]